jgi:hypothetical protein
MSVAAGWSCGVRLLKVYSRKKLNIFANKLYKVLPGSILGQVCQRTCVANGIAAGATGRQREGLRMREKEKKLARVYIHFAHVQIEEEDDEES